MLAASIVLGICLPFFWPLEERLATFNDQTGYITTARWLAETGELRSHLVYPAFLDIPDWRLYMPGHYWALALFYSLFGDHALTWVLPNLTAFVLSAAGIYLMGRKIYGERSALLAAVLFALFPANVSHAFTAMSELTTIAASIAAFCVFLYLPERVRFLCAPILLVFPFLFRETTALLVLPVSLAALMGTAGRRLLHTGVSLVGSFLMLSVVYAWQSASGKQPPPLSWILLGKPNYEDADFQHRQPDLSPGEWGSALLSNLSDNTTLLIGRLTRFPLERSEPLLTAAVVACALVAFLAGARHLRRNPYTLGFGAYGLSALVFLLLFHKSYENVAIRHLMLPFPFLALSVAELLCSSYGAVRGRRSRSLPALAGPIALGLVLVASLRWTRLRAGEGREYTTVSSQILERLGHDDESLVIYPRSLGFHYLREHYPVRWSFLPANEATLKMLAERHEIGTVILERVDFLRGGVPSSAWQAYGLHEIGGFRIDGAEYVILQRLLEAR